MKKLALRCPAKVNLHLQVLGKRPDGYHELRTLFQTIDLCDDLELELTDDGSVVLEVAGETADGLGGGPDNLVFRAAVLALQAWGAPGQGVRMRLHKRIPLGAGLGGGSSDAASTLLGLQRLLAADEGSEIWSMARKLGADVPFFLIGGAALGVGRGDEVIGLPDLPVRLLGLALPDVEISSSTVFGGLSMPRVRPMEPALLQAIHRPGWGWRDLEGSYNDLEEAVVASYPSLHRVLEALRSTEPRVAQLSGSGSAFFAVYDDGEFPDRVDGLPAGCRFVAVETLPRTSVT